MVAAVAVPVAFAAKVAGSLSITDTPQLDRLFRDGVASNCFAPKANPGTIGDAAVRVRDTYTYFNGSGRAQCTHVYLRHLCLFGGLDVNAFAQANQPFEALNPSLNYLADAGQSGGGLFFPAQHFSFVVGALDSFDVTVAQVDGPIPPACFYNLTVNIGTVSLQAPAATGFTTSRANVDHR